VVTENARLMEEVERIVAKSKANAPSDPVTAPFLRNAPRATVVPNGRP
jgi:hypothetical protein